MLSIIQELKTSNSCKKNWPSQIYMCWKKPKWLINPFQITALFLNPVKTSENLFSEVSYFLFSVGIERDQWHEINLPEQQFPQNWYNKPFKRQPREMVKHKQFVGKIANELFKCVWPFCGAGVQRVKFDV